jgi:hypothetical protein
VSNWRIKRARDAPIARHTPISLWREVARASNKAVDDRPCYVKPEAA